MARSVEGVERRFLVLQGLRWLPVGFVAPLLVLILTRDLSLTRVGPLMAIYSITTVLMELPTGGLADSLGRRPVLVLSSLASVVFFTLLLVSSGFAVLAVALFVAGLGRALDSGPLESWFVDQSKHIDPDIDLRRGLSRAGAVDGTALAIGAVVGGILPQLLGQRLLASVVAALVFQVIHLAAVLVLLVEDRDTAATSSEPTSEPEGLAAGGLAAGGLAATIGAALSMAARQRQVRRLLLGALTIGVALVAIETLWQPRFVALLDGGDGEAGANTVFLGLLLALAFVGGALGSAVAPRLAGRLERWTSASATVAQLLGALALVALAVVSWPPLAATFFIAFYAFNGAAGPLRDELLHEQIPSETRSTILSAESLAFQAGGFVAALTLPALADVAGIPPAWMVAGAVLAVGAMLYLGIERRPGT